MRSRAFRYKSIRAERARLVARACDHEIRRLQRKINGPSRSGWQRVLWKLDVDALRQTSQELRA